MRRVALPRGQGRELRHREISAERGTAPKWRGKSRLVRYTGASPRGGGVVVIVIFTSAFRRRCPRWAGCVAARWGDATARHLSDAAFYHGRQNGATPRRASFCGNA